MDDVNGTRPASENARVNGSAGNAVDGTMAATAQNSQGTNTSGRLSDEELRRRMQQQMDDLGDDDDGGMHL